MKLYINHLFLSAGITVQLSSSSVSAQPPDHVPAQAHGHFKKFVAPQSGQADIELFENGPSIQCGMHPVGGTNAHARSCLSGATSVTVVDADCPEWFGPDEECFAASIVEGDTGKVYRVNSAGTVTEIDQSDFPDEGKCTALFFAIKNWSKHPYST